jgi:hypothetical protein
MKTTIAILLFFNMSLFFCAKHKLTEQIAAKNNKEKIAFATVAVLMLPQSFVKSTAPDEGTMMSNH